MNRSRAFLTLLVIVSSLPLAASAQSQLGVLCIKGSKISVRPSCLASETVASVDTLTKKGLIGDTGPSGSNGAAGRVAAFTNHGFNTVFQSGTTFKVDCPAGKVAVGGGCYATSPFVAVTRSHPSETVPGQWVCLMKPRNRNSPFGASAFIFTYAICVDG